MPAVPPGASPEGERPTPDGRQAHRDAGGPRFTWAVGSQEGGRELSGPVPPAELPGHETDGALPAGLDWQALLDALAASGMLGGDPEKQDTDLAEELAAEQDGRMGPAMEPGKLAAMAVEHMEPGPALAGWLNVAAGAATSLDEDGLAGLAVAARKQSAHAHSVELTAVSQIASRAAAADPRIGVSQEGRPARVCRDAAGQIEMALMLSHDGAEAWADLACTLAWRLPRTGAALAGGWLDLERARIIAQATSVLSEDAARGVEEKVLPEAGRRTTARLRARLRPLVIAADPEGAEARRQKAERNANVRLYADDDQTATILADKLPQIEAAGGFARIDEMARQRKAAGLPGSLGLHRSQVLLSLILGTPLPPSESPADGNPPGQPPPAEHGLGPREGGPGPSGAHGHPGEPGGCGPGCNRGGRTAGQKDDGHRERGGPGAAPADRCRGEAGADGPPDDLPPPDEPGPPEDPPPDDLPPPDEPGPPEDPPPDDLPLPDEPPPPDEPGPPDEPTPEPVPPSDEPPPPGPLPPPAEPPPLPGERVVADEGPNGAGDRSDPGGTWDPWEEDDMNGTSPAPAWPALGPIPPAPTRPVHPDGRPPAAGLLDATLPWVTVAGLADLPGMLGRIGAITPAQARKLGRAAADDPAAQWRVIVTGGSGEAIAVERIRRRARRTRDGRRARAGPIGRITLTISHETVVACRQPGGPGMPERGDLLGGILADALRAANRALKRALAQAEADAAAGGCAHSAASPAYRPPPRLREYVIARDATCRNPVCGQPAWRADLDHTIPWQDGGRTCRCNCGGACRRDHQLKQHPRWKLRQVRPGWFQWTAPSGRTYTAGPATYIA
jgi:hypothetical protein